MTGLFSPYQLKSLTLRNRIAVPPMCQYMAQDGYPSDWHETHYRSLARGGAGLVIVEATAVSPEGRISPSCLGIWSEEHASRLAVLAKGIKAEGAIAGLQIGHAGRKANARRPWDGDDHYPEDAPEAWPIIAPSALAFSEQLHRVPKEMSLADIQRVKADFVAGAQRALAAGFEWLELHFAHGYLAQSFFSVHSNQRADAYGGTVEGRGRFLRETLAAVREVWPEHLPLTLRLGVLEFDGRDEETLLESCALLTQLKAEGADFVSVSMGFDTPQAQIPWAPGFLIPIAARVRQETGLPVATAWGLDDPLQAQQALAEEKLDLVMIGRAHLANPHWPRFAAQLLQQARPDWVLPAPYAHWLSRYRPANASRS